MLFLNTLIIERSGLFVMYADFYKEGKKNKITDKNINCLACVGISKYEDDDYSIALLRFIEELKRKKEKKE